MPSKKRAKADRFVVGAISMAWALFQLSLPRLVMLDSTTVRAIHLAFAVTLVFLTIPFGGRKGRAGPLELGRIRILDYALAGVACMSVVYFVVDWTGILMRAANPLARDIVLSIILILLLLEASRRAIGPALPIIAIVFSAYCFLGPYMPMFIAFRGVSVRRYLSQIALSTEGIYGIPLYVSASTVFLFVLFGSMLEKVGAGRFFNDLAISLLGRFRGGAGKAAVVSSGLTGLVSGSSIANVVTTGTFTIPLMKKVGYPAKIAAATEVAASTNGQLMPPIMGAAAFIIAEYLAIDYFEVVKAAAIPAFVSYFALFYITHLEAAKLGMKGLPKADIPALPGVLRGGYHFLIPLFVLIYELIVARHSPNMAAFNAIVVLVAITFFVGIGRAVRGRTSIGGALVASLKTVGEGMIAGSRNMLAVALATATAGIIVGVVFMGISSMVVDIVAGLSFGYLLPLLVITAIASLILGMGLPTTATYIVMASITVPAIIGVGSGSSQTAIPLIAAHLFCFYFGILADDTPPVGLAAYTAAAIAKSDPVATGIQGFLYDLRTAVIPFMFVFNTELLLNGVGSVWQGLLVFAMAAIGALAFANAVQGWFITRNKWFEAPVFVLASLILFCPAFLTKTFNLDYSLRYWMYVVGLALYGLCYLSQRLRLKAA